jgi:transposase InsO family protein
VSPSTFYNWRRRQGTANDHNNSVPRTAWLTTEEVQAILQFRTHYPDEGYRRLTWMMIDADEAFASPSTMHRILKKHGRLARWNRSASSKGTGFVQPTQPHEHWHTDVTYVNVCGTFFYLCSLLDGFSRYVVHWELRERMTEGDVEIIVQRAREKFPRATPRIISDNGPQFIAKDFKSFVKHCQMTHVRTSAGYPQSNGKIERWHGSLKRECIRPKTPLSLEHARSIVADYVQHYNTVRLHSAIGYVSPGNKLEGRADTILAQRQAKLAAAREQRRARHQQNHETKSLTAAARRATIPVAGETEASSAGEQLARDSRPGGDEQPSRGDGAPGSPTRLRDQDVRSFPNAFLNSDLPQASRQLKREGELSNSR